MPSPFGRLCNLPHTLHKTVQKCCSAIVPVSISLIPMYGALGICSTPRTPRVMLSRVRALLTSLGVVGAAGGDEIFLDFVA